jgi:hypothetical protein
MTRTVADLTDDEIVDAVTSFGVTGAGHWALLERLGCHVSGNNEFTLGYRMRQLDRLIVTGTGVVFRDASEWGRRLANRTAEDIAKILAGET